MLAQKMDLVDGVPVDYMHAVLEGVTRSFVFNRIVAAPTFNRARIYMERFTIARPTYRGKANETALYAHLTL